MKRLHYLLILCASMSFGCATTASVQYDRAVDFSKFHTYVWGGIEKTPDGDGRQRLLTLNPHITRVANQELAGKQLSINPNSPDLIAVTYLLKGGPRPGPERDYTLFLAFLDPSSKQRLWRGWENVTLNTSSNQQMILDRYMEKQIDLEQSVRRLLKRFPPSQK